MAPEICRCDAETRARARREGVSLYGKEVDCWSIGVLAYELLFGYLPSSDGEEWVRWEKIDFEGTNGTQRKRKHISDEAKSFVTASLQVNRESRLTVQQMLRHPWIVKNIGDRVMMATQGQSTFNARESALVQVSGMDAAHNDHHANRRQAHASATMHPLRSHSIGVKEAADTADVQGVRKTKSIDSFQALSRQNLKKPAEKQAPKNQGGSSPPKSLFSISSTMLRKARAALFGSSSSSSRRMKRVST